MQVFICKASKSHLYGNQSVSYIPLNGPGCANKKMILIRGLLLLSNNVAVKEMYSVQVMPFTFTLMH